MPLSSQEWKHAFISYSSRDRDQGERVCALLEQQGITCWIAPRDVRKGYTWAGEIVHGIQNAHVLVLLLSSRSNESEDVLNEVTFAKEKHKPVFTVRLENAAPSGDLEYHLIRHQYFEAWAGPLEKEINDLANRIAERIGIQLKQQKGPDIPAPPPLAVPEKPVIGLEKHTITIPELWQPATDPSRSSETPVKEVAPAPRQIESVTFLKKPEDKERREKEKQTENLDRFVEQKRRNRKKPVSWIAGGVAAISIVIVIIAITSSIHHREEVTPVPARTDKPGHAVLEQPPPTPEPSTPENDRKVPGMSASNPKNPIIAGNTVSTEPSQALLGKSEKTASSGKNEKQQQSVLQSNDPKAQLALGQSSLMSMDASAQRTLGDMQYERKDIAGALIAYRAAFKADPKANGFLKRYAELAIKSGTPQEKVQVLSAIIEANKADASMYRTLADIYRDQNECGKAIPLYEKSIGIDPRDPNQLSALAECQVKTGDKNSAMVTYEQVCAMNPSATKEYKALGDLYMKSGKKEQAIRAYRHYLENVPSDSKIAKIVADYEEILKSLDSVAILMKRARILVAQKKYDEAIETYKEALYFDQYYAPPMVERANVYYLQGKYPWAKTFYERALKCDPKSATAHLGLALVAKGSKDFEGYMKELGQAKTLDPNNKEIQDEARKVYTEAGAAIEKLIAAEPENIDYIMIYARILVAKKKFDEAIEKFKEISYIDQNYAPAMVERANVHYLQGKYQWAKTFYERALNIDPKAATAHLGLARVAKASNDIETYQTEMNLAKALDPNNNEIQDELQSMKK